MSFLVACDFTNVTILRIACIEEYTDRMSLETDALKPTVSRLAAMEKDVSNALYISVGVNIEQQRLKKDRCEYYSVTI